jgi:hypothetical protein
MDDYNDEQDFGISTRRPFYIEASRPVDRLPTMGQQLADAWRAEHGDEPFPE